MDSRLWTRKKERQGGRRDEEEGATRRVKKWKSFLKNEKRKSGWRTYRWPPRSCFLLILDARITLSFKCDSLDFTYDEGIRPLEHQFLDASEALKEFLDVSFATAAAEIADVDPILVGKRHSRFFRRWFSLSRKTESKANCWIESKQTTARKSARSENG